jgi:hypothetical protein
MAGFWRAMKNASGAGRWMSELQPLYQRTRQVLRGYKKIVSRFGVATHGAGV